jgi:hypothetical protein
MKTLHFGGKKQSKVALAGSMFDVGIKYTTDITQNNYNRGISCIILQQTIDSPTASQKNAHEEIFGGSFRVNGKYKIGDFIDFAQTNGLRLAIADSNGTNHETLFAADSSSSL